TTRQQSRAEQGMQQEEAVHRALARGVETREGGQQHEQRQARFNKIGKNGERRAFGCDRFGERRRAAFHACLNSAPFAEMRSGAKTSRCTSMPLRELTRNNSQPRRNVKAPTATCAVVTSTLRCDQMV